MHDGPTLRPIGEPLRLAALEVADLARMADDLQGVIARLAACGGRPDPALIAEAQASDFLSQRLAGVAAFLGALGAAAPADATADVYAAVMDLTLAEQARRLSGPPAREAAAAAPADQGGELQLFDF